MENYPTELAESFFPHDSEEEWQDSIEKYLQDIWKQGTDNNIIEIVNTPNQGQEEERIHTTKHHNEKPTNRSRYPKRVCFRTKCPNCTFKRKRLYLSRLKRAIAKNHT